MYIKWAKIKFNVIELMEVEMIAWKICVSWNLVPIL
jgi:hypothetical protein